MGKEQPPPATAPLSLNPVLAEVLRGPTPTVVSHKGNPTPAETAEGRRLRELFDQRHAGDSCRLL